MEAVTACLGYSVFFDLWPFSGATDTQQMAHNKLHCPFDLMNHKIPDAV